MNSALSLYADLTGDVSNKIYLGLIELRFNNYRAISEKFDIACFERGANSLHPNRWNLFRVQMSSIKSRLPKILVDSLIPIVQTAGR
jgi:hypothetical protein